MTRPGRNFTDKKPRGWRSRLQTWLDRRFPERQVIVRAEGRVSHMRISQRAQVSIAAMLVALMGWGTFSSVNYLLHTQIVADKNNQIANARLAYRTLLGEVADYQKKFNLITREIEENQGSMSPGLREQTAQLEKDFSSVETQLRTTEQEREQMSSARDRLQGQLIAIEKTMSSLAARNFTTNGNTPAIDVELQTALAERNQALFEANELRRQMRETENKLSTLRETQLESVRQLADRTTGFIESTEKVLRIAGVDPTQLLAANKSKPRGGKGLGGPFIPLKSAKAALGNAEDDPFASEMESLSQRLARWEALQGAMQHIPLAAPLATYAVNSHFGKRIDPVNNMWAAHYGLDLGAPLRSKVQATAPGVVTFAGFQDKFGRMVEIDHGYGLVTRYAHLDKTLVKKGDKVGFNQEIALLGNSGRSTGAHLHYEILFQGKPKNPMSFIKAGQHVFKE